MPAFYGFGEPHPQNPYRLIPVQQRDVCTRLLTERHLVRDVMAWHQVHGSRVPVYRALG